MSNEDIADMLESWIDKEKARDDRMKKLEAVAEAAKSFLSEDGIREKASCYVMGVELIERLSALEDK